jgi:hypothetical protein
MAKVLSGLNKPLLDLDKKPFVDPTNNKLLIKSIIANCLAKSSSEDPVRAMKIALDIHNSNDTLTLEDADFELIKKALLEDKLLNNIAKAAALEILNP